MAVESSQLSPAAKVGVGTGGLGAGMAAVYLFMAQKAGVLWIVLGGVVAVIVLLLIYFYLLRRIDWRKALRLQSVLGSGTPAGLTPQELADLTAARKAFQ